MSDQTTEQHQEQQHQEQQLQHPQPQQQQLQQPQPQQLSPISGNVPRRKKAAPKKWHGGCASTRTVLWMFLAFSVLCTMLQVAPGILFRSVLRPMEEHVLQEYHHHQHLSVLTAVKSWLTNQTTDDNYDSDKNDARYHDVDTKENEAEGSEYAKCGGGCAINLYGLPRAFKTLALPTIQKNVLERNWDYDCDYFVHTHYLQEEPHGRHGQGGKIDPNDILLLQDALQNISATKRANASSSTDRQRRQRDMPVILFSNHTDEQFYQEHGPLLEKVTTTRLPNKASFHKKSPLGNLVYFPIQDFTFTFPGSIVNIVKAWHAQRAVWNLMQEYSQQSGCHYHRVAMLRVDVVYMTPVDIYEVPPEANRVVDHVGHPRFLHLKRHFGWLHNNTQQQESHTTVHNPNNNKVAAVPGFAKYPVNDRAIMGPYDAVKLWSTIRFDLLDDHVEFIKHRSPGHGMHPERMLAFTVFPFIKVMTGIELRESPTLCFLLARADESVWTSKGCGGPNVTVEDNIRVLQELTGRTCRFAALNVWQNHLECHPLENET